MSHRKTLRAALLAACALGMTGGAAAPLWANPAEVPLIPRSALFGNPVKSAAQISPDGTTLAWLAPDNGVMNVWVAPVANPANARVLTRATERPIPQYFWSPDSSSILYVQDKAGDENFLLYSVNAATGVERNLTPFQNTRVMVFGVSEKHQNEILIGLNNREPRWHDAYRLNLTTGQLTEVMRGDGYAGFQADDDLNIRIAVRPNAAGGMDFFRVNGTTVDSTAFLSTDLENSDTSPIGFTTDGSTLYWVDSRNRDTAAIFAQNMASGEMTLIAEDNRADLGSTMRDPRTGVIQGYRINYLRPEWRISDRAVAADYDFLKQRFPDADVSIADRTRNDDKWIVSVGSPTTPAATYVFDRRSRAVTELFVSRPELQNAPLVAQWPVEIQARDGLTLPSYLTLPRGADANNDGRADHPVPMVLLVHGGPWARDVYGFNGYHQWLANRGYAVLSVNFRASTGFGKRFLNAGNQQWGLKMHEDLIDAVNWAVAQGVTTSDKVGIMGGSYGGYATLAGLTFTPETFACGVDIVGPSNLETLLATIPPYWEAGRNQMYQRMGNPNTPEGQAVLRAASPLYRAAEIRRPLLIGQGANDPRVKQTESDQIVSAMQANNIPVTYVLFPDEGHGFRRPENNIAFSAVAETFLSGCLGGRAEPMGTTLSASTAQVPTGAQFVPGLAEAARRPASE